eukprot:TRINITY_DN22363_c1_g1_i1.p1 TRINITY_DN22363_c1_g1~~TRINITY_DN22363_c1_g1_i1.p1  ORF type:complete len:827 (+),score=133.90 TRINITY_DN22363_c1_g1_i1:78-2558(+)
MTTVQHAAEEAGSMSVSNGLEATQLLNVAWVLLCAFLVVSMQLGFAMLEVGSCRKAHRMTVLAKNVLDSAVSAIGFCCYSKLNNPSVLLIGSPDGTTQARHMIFFLWGFCANSVTVCSGSMAERVHMVAYLSYAFVMSSIIYPPLAESVWGQDSRAFLHYEFHGRIRGHAYHDFAGSGIVHLTGGISALIGNILLGRRIMISLPESDDETPKGPSQHASDLADRATGAKGSRWARRFEDSLRDKIEFKPCGYLQAMGMFILWVGWYGFNTGPVLNLGGGGAAVAGMVAWNTTLSAAMGGIGAFINCFCIQQHLDVSFICNGVLGGLVAITAACDVATQEASMILGLLAGLFVYPASSALVTKLRLDDPVDAISVHACCGLLGVLGVGLCRPPCSYLQMFGGGANAQIRFCAPDHMAYRQLLAQLWGAVLMIAWAGAVSLALFGIFAVPEYARACEAKFMQEAEGLLGSLLREETPNIEAPAATAEAASRAQQLRSLAQQSTPVRLVLESNGWTTEGGFPDQVDPELWMKRLKFCRWALVELRERRYETALEGDETGWCGLWHAGKALRACCRAIGRLTPTALSWSMPMVRLRISPSAELSGLGAAESDGGQLLKVLQKVVKTPLKEYELQQEQKAAEMKREMQELMLLVGSQDALLQALVRNAGRGRPPRLPVGRLGAEGVRQLLQNAGTTSASIDYSSLVSRPHAPPSFSSECSSNASRSSAGSMSTVSDKLAGQLTPHSDINTPPPTLLGLASRAQRTIAMPRQTGLSAHDEELALDLLASLRLQQENLFRHAEGSASADGIGAIDDDRQGDETPRQGQDTSSL